MLLTRTFFSYSYSHTIKVEWVHTGNCTTPTHVKGWPCWDSREVIRDGRYVTVLPTFLAATGLPTESKSLCFSAFGSIIYARRSPRHLLALAMEPYILNGYGLRKALMQSEYGQLCIILTEKKVHALQRPLLERLITISVFRQREYGHVSYNESLTLRKN